MFYEVLRLCGGPIIDGLKSAGGSVKEDPHVRGGRGRGGGRLDHMSSNDVGSYEFKRSPCEMQMDLS